MITQEQFNEIIDLLGDVAIARLALETLPFRNTSIDRSQFQTDIDHALSVYNQAVTALYQPGTIPEVYSSAYHPKMNRSSSSYCGEQIKLQETHTINIAPVIKQLNQDFVLCDCTDEEIYTPLSYTGRHKGPNRNQIELTATFEQNPEPGLFPIIIPNFWMDVLSHVLTLLLSAVLIGAGAGVVASGLGTVLGVCMIVAGAALWTGYLGTNGLGLFSGPQDRTTPLSSASPEQNDMNHGSETPDNNL